ncbi:hypothetical protein D9M68_608290 [compost metagenome]
MVGDGDVVVAGLAPLAGIGGSGLVGAGGVAAGFAPALPEVGVLPAPALPAGAFFGDTVVPAASAVKPVLDELAVLTASFCVKVPPASTAMPVAALTCVPSSVVSLPDDSRTRPPLVMLPPVAVSLFASPLPTPSEPSPLRWFISLPPDFLPPLAGAVAPVVVVDCALPVPAASVAPIVFAPADTADDTPTLTDSLLCVLCAALKARLPPASTATSPWLASAVPVKVASPPDVIVSGPLPLRMLPATSSLEALFERSWLTPPLPAAPDLPAATSTATLFDSLFDAVVFLAASKLSLPPVATPAAPTATTFVPSNRASPVVVTFTSPPAWMPPTTAVRVLWLLLLPA